MSEFGPDVVPEPEEIIEIDEDGVVHAPETKAQLRARIKTLENRLRGFEALCCGDCDMASAELRALSRDAWLREMRGEAEK